MRTSIDRVRHAGAVSTHIEELKRSAVAAGLGFLGAVIKSLRDKH